jgi:protein involved in polysaccharide export with SLBB domain
VIAEVAQLGAVNALVDGDSGQPVAQPLTPTGEHILVVGSDVVPYLKHG